MFLWITDQITSHRHADSKLLAAFWKVCCGHWEARPCENSCIQPITGTYSTEGPNLWRAAEEGPGHQVEKSKLSGVPSLAGWFEVPPFSSCPVRSVFFIRPSRQFVSFLSRPASLLLHTSRPDQTSVLPSYLDLDLDLDLYLDYPVEQDFEHYYYPYQASFNLILSRITLPPSRTAVWFAIPTPIHRFLRCPALSCTTSSSRLT